MKEEEYYCQNLNAQNKGVSLVIEGKYVLANFWPDVIHSLRQNGHVRQTRDVDGSDG
jgi:hypothetical protein